jgi:hypothetical protein
MIWVITASPSRRMSAYSIQLQVSKTLGIKGMLKHQIKSLQKLSNLQLHSFWLLKRKTQSLKQDLKFKKLFTSLFQLLCKPN